MKCPECGARLNNYDTFWDCPECGYYKTKAKYAKIEAQNERFLKRFFENDSKPEGCAACGNPAYPDCQTKLPAL